MTLMTVIAESLLAAVVLSFTLTLGLLFALRRPAHSLGLVDQPGGRKDHAGAVPLIGGIALVAGFLFAQWLYPSSIEWGLMASMVAVAVMGAVDDRRSLSCNIRLALQVGLAALLVAAGGVLIPNLGDLTGTGTLTLGWLAIPFTLLCLTGLINAINMLDGIDGLAGGSCLVMLGWLAVVAWLGGAPEAKLEPLLLVGGLAAFLCVNFPWLGLKRAGAFLGDAGSMALGVALGWLAIDIVYGQGLAVPPITVAWILALPVLDSLCVMLRRVMRHGNPLRPGRDHAHHYLVDLGLPRPLVSWVLILVTALNGAIGVGGWWLGVPEWLLFAGFMAFALIHLALLEFGLSRASGIVCLSRVGQRTNGRLRLSQALALILRTPK